MAATESTFCESLSDLLDRLRLQVGEAGEEYKFGDPSKVLGELRTNSRVCLVWAASGDTHQGQVFTLPGLECKDVWMGGVIFVAEPFFSGDMDCPGPIWMTVDQALKNDQIEGIWVFRG